MNFTLADLDALKEALTNPAKEVTIGDRKMSFRSVTEILQMIKVVQSVLDGAPSESKNVISTTYTKGRK